MSRKGRACGRVRVGLVTHPDAPRGEGVVAALPWPYSSMMISSPMARCGRLRRQIGYAASVELGRHETFSITRSGSFGTFWRFPDHSACAGDAECALGRHLQTSGRDRAAAAVAAAVAPLLELGERALQLLLGQEQAVADADVVAPADRLARAVPDPLAETDAGAGLGSLGERRRGAPGSRRAARARAAPPPPSRASIAGQLDRPPRLDLVAVGAVAAAVAREGGAGARRRAIRAAA